LPGSYAVTVPVMVPSFDEDWVEVDCEVVVVDWLPEDWLPDIDDEGLDDDWELYEDEDGLDEEEDDEDGLDEDCELYDDELESGFVVRVCVSVLIDPSEPMACVVIFVTTTAPDADGSVTIETVRPTATSEGTDELVVRGNVCSRPSAPTTTMLWPAS